MLNNVWLALAITFVLALAWLRVNDFAAHRGWIGGPLSRKIIHMGTGLLFVLCWLLFPDIAWSRYLAALVPFAITLQFALVGTGILKDEAAVQAMSRCGDRREILRGPLFYGIVFVLITILFWREHPAGIIALMLLCGGDGLADIIGKRIGTSRVPWSKEKSVAGSIAMFAGGWFFTMIVLAIYVSAGVFAGPFAAYLWPVTLIALVGALIESFPYSDIDNLTVPTAAVLLALLLL
jgi:phytol kinase